MRTYLGSCHCGAVRYEADIDFDAGTSKCNCTFCSKARLWAVIIKPDAFRLLSGRTELSDYYKPGGAVHHFFCRHCGIRPFEEGYLEVLGGDYVTINVACLDTIEPRELAQVRVTYMDGRRDSWFSPPAETRHLSP
jgi:hypothetical protein